MTGLGVLIVGYGNSLRGDDGIGWHAARLLATDTRLAAGSFAEGDGLSSALRQVLPEVVEVVTGVVGGQRPT